MADSCVDIITDLARRDLLEIIENIFYALNADGLVAAEQVCCQWRTVTQQPNYWRRLIELKLASDHMWPIANDQIPMAPNNENNPTSFRKRYFALSQMVEAWRRNWRRGVPVIRPIPCGSQGVHCLQFDHDQIISGHRDHSIQMRNKQTLQLTSVLRGHGSSVYCLQFDENIIVSGSGDRSVKIWSRATGQCMKTLSEHGDSVLCLRLGGGVLVAGANDGHLVVWDMASPAEIQLRLKFSAHERNAAVNAVELDHRYIVSAGSDRVIRIWNVTTLESVRVLTGHTRRVACLAYRSNLIASGSSDNTVRLWNVESGECLKTLTGHLDLVRCIWIDDYKIVSGDYNGRILVWDLHVALHGSDQENPCYRLLMGHNGRVLHLQADEFQVVSSGIDDKIVVWDFRNCESHDGELVVFANL